MIKVALIIFLFPALVYTVLGNNLSKTERYTAELLAKTYIILTMVFACTCPLPFGIGIILLAIPALLGKWTKAYIVLTGIIQICYWLQLYIFV